MNDSMKDMEIRLEKNPKSFLFARLADMYLDEGRSEEALRLCQEGIKHHPSYVTGHFILAKAHLARGEQEEAEAALKRVITHDREFLAAHKLLGDLMARQGWENKAAVYYRDILEIDPLENETREILKSFSLDEPGDELGFHEPLPIHSREDLNISTSTTGIKKQDWEEEFDRLFESRPENASPDEGVTSIVDDSSDTDVPAPETDVAPDSGTIDPDTDEIEAALEDLEKAEERIDTASSIPAKEDEEIVEENDLEITIEIPEPVGKEDNETEELDLSAFDIPESPSAMHEETTAEPSRTDEEEIFELEIPEESVPPAPPAAIEDQSGIMRPGGSESESENLIHEDELLALPDDAAADTDIKDQKEESSPILDPSGAIEIDLDLDKINPQTAAGSHPPPAAADKEVDVPLDEISREKPPAKPEDLADSSAPQVRSSKDEKTIPEKKEPAPAAESEESGTEESSPKLVSPTLGEIYTAQGQYSKAIKVYETLLEKSPDNTTYKKKIEALKKRLNEAG